MCCYSRKIPSKYKELPLLSTKTNEHLLLQWNQVKYGLNQALLCVGLWCQVVLPWMLKTGKLYYYTAEWFIHLSSCMNVLYGCRFRFKGILFGTTIDGWKCKLFIRVVWHPFTFLAWRALWKRRRKEARLKRYMLLIFDRSVMTKYILLALSARGR